MSRTNTAMPSSSIFRSRLLLVLLLTLVFVADAHATKGPVFVSKGHNNEHNRWLEQSEFNDADADNDDMTGYNPCSLCQGLVLLADKIPDPERNPNLTCSIFERRKSKPQNATNDVQGCRAKYYFNEMFTKCCRAPIFTHFECENNIHDYLFGGFGPYGKYNPAVPPIMGPELDQKLNISISLQFEALTEVAVEEGTATMYVTMKLMWNDPRLKWEVAGDTCSNSIEAFTGHDQETTSIWIPDFDLINRIEGIQSMPAARAKVFSDGTVEWTVSGGMKTFCAFKGLANIPFDTIGCQMLFGSHIQNNLINYVLETPDYIFYGLFDTTYNEWMVIPELAEHGYAVNGNTIYYNVFFRRSTENYLSSIVVPTIILTYLSFMTFLLDVRVGERLGFGMALALVVVTNQIVTTGMTPISNQGLWLDKFVAYSFYFVLVGVIQSVIIGYLYFIREDKRERDEITTEIDEKELQPLNDYSEPELIESGDPVRRIAASEALGEETAKKELYLKTSLKDFIFKYPLRKIDMLAFVMSIATYTVFIIRMISMATNNKWTGDEPQWFNETSHDDYSKEPYINGDPNNRYQL